MLKIYIIISIIAMILNLLTNVRWMTSKNVRIYMKKHNDKTMSEKMWSEFIGFIKCLIPIKHLAYIAVYLFIIFASEANLLKTLEKAMLKIEVEKKEIEEILNK